MTPHCRFCGAPLTETFVDLGMSPLCESFLLPEQLNEMEPFYPLHVWVCGACFLVQLEQYVAPEDIFTDYAYFSSFSDSWLSHAERYVEQMVATLDLGAESQVVEIASNDGYLLQYFAKRGVPVLGIEPARNVAEVAERRGIPTRTEFFDAGLAATLAAEGLEADLVVGNNVLAQVPDLNAFVAGLPTILAPEGTVTLEFPHVLRLMEQNQFDTIYHEHFSYFSLGTCKRIFEHHGLTVFDVEELPTHGGSLRLHLRHSADHTRPVAGRVQRLLDMESRFGLWDLATYRGFGERVAATKRRLLDRLIRAKEEGKSIAAYGAPGKGNTLLNYCGIRTDFLDYAADRSTFKHGRFTPGTHIPIFPPERIAETRPDYVLILPWNLRDEIMSQLAYIREWSGRFLVPIPELQELPA